MRRRVPGLTPYHYSSYDLETEVVPSDAQKVVILGSGPEPHRAGRRVRLLLRARQLRAARRRVRDHHDQLQPRDVSTDYDTSDRLYFEPLTLEDVLEVIHAEQQSGELLGVIVQLGGQTRSGSRRGSKAAGIPILGTSPSAIDLAEERGLFSGILDAAGLLSPKNGTRPTLPARSGRRGDRATPVLVRPSFVLGGRGMEIVYDTPASRTTSIRVREQAIIGPGSPLLVDRFLDDALEIDIDALYDGTELYVGGIMEHIEEAGIHSGDSACTLPPVTLGRDVQDQVVEATRRIAEGIGRARPAQRAVRDRRRRALRARGQPAGEPDGAVRVEGARASRWPRPASLLMAGHSIRSLVASGLLPEATARTCRSIRRSRSRRRCCRSSVPHPRGQHRGLGARPEMRSTGEVMGIDVDFPRRFAKSQDAAYGGLPTSGTGVRLGRRSRQARDRAADPAALAARDSTSSPPRAPAEVLARNGIRSQSVRKYFMGQEVVPGRAVDRRAHQRGQDRCRDQHAVRTQRPRGRVRDPDGDGRADKPLFTTIAQLGAAVAAFEVVRGRRARGAPARTTRWDRAGRLDGGEARCRCPPPSPERTLASAVGCCGPLCVGIDPHASLLAQWGLADTATEPGPSGLRVVDAVAGRPESSSRRWPSFERTDPPATRALEDVLHGGGRRAARHRGREAGATSARASTPTAKPG
jgi:carbamoyl-phosphate synthase large subunit